MFGYFSNVFARIQNRMPRLKWWPRDIKCLSIGFKIIVFSTPNLDKYAVFGEAKMVVEMQELQLYKVAHVLNCFTSSRYFFSLL